MGVGGVAFGALALLGMHTLLTHLAWLYMLLKIAGGLYLLYLAWRLWQGAGRPLQTAGIEAGAEAADATPWRSFLLGLTTQLSNPKTAVVYGSIFAALLPAHPSTALYVALPPLIFLIETGWYALVALGFSSERPRAAYLRGKAWMDRLVGGLMGLLGLKLIYHALPEQAP